MRSWLPSNLLKKPKLLLVGASLALILFIALGGSAVAAKALITAKEIATGAVTSKIIKNGTITAKDLNKKTIKSLKGGAGVTGLKGYTGSTGANGANGPNGANGGAGIDGNNGTNGANGANGANGPNGANGSAGIDGNNGTNGANGPNGANGLDGSDGINGADGVDGIDGADGVLGPLAATTGLIALPTATPPTVVVSLAVPAGNYVVFAKTQLSNTGAGDTVDCMLKAGTTTIDQVSMKTLPALAAIPASLQAVTTTSPTQLSVECDVLTANGSANFSSLLAIPTS
jgi:hypothetical protein